MRTEKNQMIKVSMLYPNEKGKKFDIGYCFNKHVPMVQELMGPALKGGGRNRTRNQRRGTWFRADLCGDGSFVFRFGGKIPSCLRAAHGNDIRRYSQLFGSSADGADQ